MKVKISNIKIPLESKMEVKDYLLNLGIKDGGSVKIIKESLDFRKKSHPAFVYSVCADVDEKLFSKIKKTADVTEVKEKAAPRLEFGEKSLKNRPVIVGFGPCGMFCAYELAKRGYRPIVLERGADVDARSQAVERFWQNGVFDKTSNVQFGEGGAGTFSDGKLTTRVNDFRSDYILETFVKFGAPKEIIYEAKPHIGTDVLKKVVKNMRLETQRLGGEVRFNEQLIDVCGSKKVTAAVTARETVECEVLVMAIGHSARDSFEMLYSRGVCMTAKDFAVGLRIEHLQKKINEAQYGDFAAHPKLKNADYNLACRVFDRGVYTFCMCPGGCVVAAASEEGGVVTNGMSYHARDGVNANSAIVAQVFTSDFGKNVFDAMNFQRQLEKAAFSSANKTYRAPTQTVESLMGTKATWSALPSYMPGVEKCDFEKIMPKFVINPIKEAIKIFDVRLKGFGDGGAVLTGVETRTSSPVRIQRGEDMQSINFTGLYPAGEGAGYAGGIMSAAIDGIKIAEKIISQYKPF